MPTDRVYCCDAFKDSVEEGIFIKSEQIDETEWFIDQWLHIYYCPFCGAHIKGEGYGDYDIKHKPTT